MTTKTHIAMFAIAAFAVIGFGFAPAYATVYTSDQHTVFSGNNNGGSTDRDSAGCGSSDECHVDFSVISGQSQATVWFGVSGNSECDVKVTLVGSGWNETVYAWNVDYSNGYSVINGPNSIDVNDTMTYSAEFSDCA